jgi:beta-phosphoglucomutase-like phosphatase (HAD superfamily)
MSPSGSAPPSSCALSPRDYDAVLFDLDGVLTRTASVHAAAWKRLFDEFLEKRSVDTGEPFVPFDIDTDYRRHVDGKPRYRLQTKSQIRRLPWLMSVHQRTLNKEAQAVPVQRPLTNWSRE